MKIELIRTDEERQRYRQLVESNRQRRREISQINREPRVSSNERREKQKTPIFAFQSSIVDEKFSLTENDWMILSNVVNSYENFCLKTYVEKRRRFDDDEDHFISFCLNNINPFVSFLSSIPAVKNLSSADRIYLCKQNVCPLIFANLHELEQTCFSEPWQVDVKLPARNHRIQSFLFFYSFVSRSKSTIGPPNGFVGKFFIINTFRLKVELAPF